MSLSFNTPQSEQKKCRLHVSDNSFGSETIYFGLTDALKNAVRDTEYKEAAFGFEADAHGENPRVTIELKPDSVSTTAMQQGEANERQIVEFQDFLSSKETQILGEVGHYAHQALESKRVAERGDSWASKMANAVGIARDGRS